MGRILLLDPSVAGISGNMLIGCLLDLGAPLETLRDLAALVSRESGTQVRLRSKRVRRHGFAAQWADWEVESQAKEEVTGAEFLEQVQSIVEATATSHEAKGMAMNAARILVQAEADVHDATPDTVHFHELASLDTVLDVVGTVVLLDALGLTEQGSAIYSTAVAVGRGPIDVRHGHLQVPPFVTSEILRAHSIPFRLGPAEDELATPTGIALLAAMVDGFDPDFTIRPEKVGYGAGGRDIEGVPNVLKAIMGIVGSPGEESISMLETNLDDVTGELLGHLGPILLRSGALDYQLISTLTKKGRPGYLLQVMCPPGKEDDLAATIMRETGSLGVRVNRMQRRLVLDREVVRLKVKGLQGLEVTFKVARDADGTVVSVKPEFEDLRVASKRLGITLREARQRAEADAAPLYGKG